MCTSMNITVVCQRRESFFLRYSKYVFIEKSIQSHYHDRLSLFLQKRFFVLFFVFCLSSRFPNGQTGVCASCFIDGIATGN